MIPATLKSAAIAAALSVLGLVAPAQADKEVDPYGTPTSENVIKADDLHEAVLRPRSDDHSGYLSEKRRDAWRELHRVHHRHRPPHRAHHRYRPYHLKPWEVRYRLRRRGFHNMHFVDRWAPVYKLRATGPRGRRVFIVVSSRTGLIIDRRPIRRHHRRHHWH